MEMHQVRYFLAVSRVLNFTRAAEECNVAQPSLTRAIKQLEEEFGGELFRRERNLTHLSDLGHRMLPMMQQCFDSAQSAKQLATSIKSGAVAPLSIGLSLANSWDRLDTWPLFTEPYRLAVGGKHRLSARGIVPPGDLAKERFLCRTYCENVDQLTGFLARHGVTPEPSHKVVSENDLVTLLDAGLGYALVPQSSAPPGSVKFLELDGLDVTRTVQVYGVAGRQRSPAANTLVKMLRAADWSAYEVADAPVKTKRA